MAEDAMLIRLLIPGVRPQVLDYGMGSGHWASIAQSYDCDVWGTDVDSNAPTIARKRGFTFSPLAELPDNHFDFINADQVIEHLSEPADVLRRLVRKLKTGGLLKISVPGDPRIERKMARAAAGKYSATEFLKDFETIQPLIHLNLFAKKSLLALGKQVQLSPFRVPLMTSYSTMTLFDSPRQWNRNLYHPYKRSRAAGTWQFLRK